MSDYQWCFENPRDAADLIEQQQQRIVELERKLRLEEELHHVTESGYTELFATIERQQQQIAELEQREAELSATVERLKAQQSEVAARAVEDAVMNTPTHRMKVDERLYHSQRALLDYANQLREQGDE